MKRSTAWCLALGIDIAAGELPAAIHPVVLVGRGIAILERQPPADPAAALGRGIILVAVPGTLAAIVGWAAEQIPDRRVRSVASLLLLSSSFALRGLVEAGRQTELALESGDLVTARTRVRALVSRPTADLDGAHLASAVVESLAENLVDSYVAPMAWYALGGLPAVLVYRVVNTADAMVGYRGTYEYLGKPAARLDDVANLVPAWLGVASIVAAAPFASGSARDAWRTTRRDGGRTASPNAGRPMAAAAGALGVWLEKPGVHLLGIGGRTPTPADARRAGRLVVGAALLATVVFVAVDRWRGRGPA